MWCSTRFCTRAFDFFIFINNLSNSSKFFHPVIFAGDTNLFCCDITMSILFQTVNQQLDQINDWFLANIISLNVEKSKYMLFDKLKIKIIFL